MELFKISKRLQTVAALVHKGNIVADIGTDHAYLPIYIVKQNISDKVIAMDVRKGPLEKAKQNVSEHGVGDNVCLRLSNGLEKLSVNEAQTITICGMGGKLIRTILENGEGKYDENTQFILSPQSEIRDFREYLGNNGFITVGEHMLKEDGQFYLIVECVKSNNVSTVLSEEAYVAEATLQNIETMQDELQREVHLRYGKMLLEAKDECLREFLNREKEVAESVYNTVSKLANKDGAVLNRIAQLEMDIKCAKKALEYYE